MLKLRESGVPVVVVAFVVVAVVEAAVETLELAVAAVAVAWGPSSSDQVLLPSYLVHFECY